MGQARPDANLPACAVPLVRAARVRPPPSGFSQAWLGRATGLIGPLTGGLGRVGWTPGGALIAALRSSCPGVQRLYASRIVATSHGFGDGSCWYLRVSARRSLHRRSSSKLHSTQRGCKHRLFIPTERLRRCLAGDPAAGAPAGCRWIVIEQAGTITHIPDERFPFSKFWIGGWCASSPI